MTQEVAIQLENIHHTYTDESQWVLKGIDLDIFKQEFCVLLGKSGSGKSTLLRCINGLNQPTSGQVHIEGEPVLEQNLRQVRKKVGMVFQEYHLVNRLTVLENVLCGILPRIPNWRAACRYFKSEEKDYGQSLLEKVGLGQFSHARADQLSGGQKQRVGIARALAQKPSILLADEPVSSLDPVSSEEILGLLLEICQTDKLTLVVSLHQIEYAKMFGERIIGLKHGKIMFDNEPSELSLESVNEIYERGVLHA